MQIPPHTYIQWSVTKEVIMASEGNMFPWSVKKAKEMEGKLNSFVAKRLPVQSK